MLKGMKVLVADMGGTRIKTGLVENDGILASGMVETARESDFTQVMNLLEKAFIRHLEESGSKRETVGSIGIALPGLVDSDRNIMLDVKEKLTGSLDYDFNAWAQRCWGLPLAAENDARAALVGSWQFGAGRGCDNLVMVTLGTGVGTAAIIEGQLLRGKHYQAGNLGGHFTVSLDGPVCNCGNIGCVEALGSTWMLQRSGGSPGKKLDFERLFKLYREGEPASRRMMVDILKAWSACAVNLVHAFDPEKIVFSGGVMRSADIILPFISDWVDKHAWTDWGKVELLAEQNTEEIALLGMGYLARKRLKN